MRGVKFIIEAGGLYWAGSGRWSSFQYDAVRFTEFREANRVAEEESCGMPWTVVGV